MRPKLGAIRGMPASHVAGDEGTGHEALQSMLTGEYTEESTGARTIRQTGGKDRHSKVFTSRGPRDRRVRLSVATAIRFYDLQDRLGFEQPSKAVEWLLLNCQPSIKALPQLGSIHRSHASRTIAALPAAHLKGHPSPHIQAMNLKSTKENITHHNTLYNHKFTHNTPYHDHSAQLPFLHHNQRNIQACLYNDVKFLHTLSLHHAQHSNNSIEAPPQSSNPSSSGGSSDHPISIPKALQNQAFKSDAMICTAELRQQSNSTSTSVPINKRRRVPRPSSLSDQVDHQAPNDEFAKCRTEANAGNTSIMSNDRQRFNCLASMSQILLGRNDVMAARDDPCPSLISSKTGKVYGAGDHYSQLISNNMSMNMGTNPLLSMKESDFLINNSMLGTQMDVATQPTVGIPDDYANIAQLQRLQAAANDVANDTLMSFATVEGDSLSGVSAHLNDTMQLYGNMGICSTMDVSPSESNNINMVGADYVDGKGAQNEMRVNHDEVEEYGPSFNEWALRHALL